MHSSANSPTLECLVKKNVYSCLTMVPESTKEFESMIAIGIPVPSEKFRKLKLWKSGTR